MKIIEKECRTTNEDLKKHQVELGKYMYLFQRPKIAIEAVKHRKI